MPVGRAGAGAGVSVSRASTSMSRRTRRSVAPHKKLRNLRLPQLWWDVIIRRFVAAVGLLFVGAAPVVAGEPTDQLRTFFERANQVLLAPESEGGGFEERLATVRGLVNEVIDFDGAAALALGRHWETLSPSARTTFTRLYADVVERAYLSWVGSKARVGEGGVSIRWIDESIDGDAAVVTSELLTRTSGEMPIEYRMVRRPAGWLVRGIVVDGLSLAANS